MEIDFEQLYVTYYMRVYSFVLTLAKNQDISDEITQKTLLYLYGGTKGLSHEFSVYIFLRMHICSYFLENLYKPRWFFQVWRMR